MLSFTSRESLGWTLAEHLPRLGDWAGERWGLLLRAFDGSDISLVISGVNGPDWAKFPRIIVTVELAVLAAAAARLRQWTGLRHAAAWLAVAGLFAAASFLAPYPLKVHHYSLILAFPRLAWAGLAASVFPAWAPRLSRQMILAAFFLVPILAAQAAVTWRFSADLGASGGSREYPRSLIDAAAWIKSAAAREPSLGVVDGARLLEILSLETGGGVRIDKIPPPEHWISSDGLNRAEVLLFREVYAVVGREGSGPPFPYLGGGELAAEFRDREGRLLYEIRRLHGAPGERFLEPGMPPRERLERGLQAWFKFYETLASAVPADQRAELWFHLAREAGAPDCRLLPPAERKNPPSELLKKLAERALGRAKAAEGLAR